METRQIVTTFLLGCFLLALGLIPGVVQGIMKGLENFRDSLSHFPPRSHHSIDTGERFPGQIWFAVAGAALMAISLLALISK